MKKKNELGHYSLFFPATIILSTVIMNQLYFRILLFTFLLFLLSCTAQKNSSRTTPDTILLSTIQQNFTDAAAQYKVMMKNLPPARFLKTYHAKEDRLETSGSDWWCSGFYPGTLLYLHEETKDPALLTEAERMLNLLEKEKLNTSLQR